MTQRAIVVDHKGKPLGIVSWEADEPRPPLPDASRWRKNARPKKYLLDFSYARRGMRNWRWAFKTKRWKKPSARRYVVNERGNLVRDIVIWADEEATTPLPEGYSMVSTAPTKDRRRGKPYWDGAEWDRPQVKYHVDDTGALVNTILVRKEDTYDVPTGHSLQDDPPPVEPPPE